MTPKEPPQPDADCRWPRGCVQLYTGDGKGKTTAALGLALRAAGAGLRVCIIQFAKGRPTSELEALERLAEHITVQRFGRPDFVVGQPRPADMDSAAAGLAAARAALCGGQYRLVILDEAAVAVHLGLLTLEALLELIAARPRAVELVITGRGAPPAMIDAADLVTEMRCVKHYYDADVPARRGIES